MVTIRAKILLAFLLMSALTGGLGVYAVRGIGVTGGLVVETFDNALMSINYARAAAADFAAMEAALARQGHHADPDLMLLLDRRIEEAAELLTGDLEIAAERALSRHAVLAAGEVGRAVAAWQAARAELAVSATTADWSSLDRLADEVRERIDLLINHTAGDGFQHRQRAAATVTSIKRLNAAGVAAAVLLSAVVAVLLARRIMGPVAAASGAAKRIAAGELDTPIPAAGADELGALLAAMTVMRDNIRAMVALEVAERRSAQGRLVDAIEGSREGVMLVDGSGRIAICNSQFARFFPALAALLTPGGSVAAVAAAAREGGVFTDPAAADLLLGERDATREERLSDGRWVRVSRSATREGGFVALCSDVTPLKEREAELETTNRRFDAALSNMSQGLSMFDADDRLRIANRRFGEVYGVDPDRMPPGTPLRDILAMKVAAGHHAGQDVEDVLGEAEAFIRRRESGLRFRNLSGGRVVAVSHEPMADGGWVATHEDITERRRAEAQLAFMARHDALTSLPNRALFRERMDQAIAQLGRDADFAVLCLDLDHFKGVNDTLGHPVGDRLLQAVAERLLACVREVDTVARLGGDEFAVIQVGIERPEDAVELARRLVARLGEPFDLDGQQVVLGASVGIALAPGDGAQADALLRNADTALYRAKLDGRATYRFFEADMDARLQARRLLELDLRRAVATGEFELFYQPLVQLASDRVCGFEALLRWRHPTRGMVSPAEFIPLAEETGLIVPMGEWALRRACAEAMAWPDHVKIAVNVSPVQFKNPRLVESVMEALAVSGLPSRRLELEITESTLLQDNESTLATLHRLRALGLRISMDDFGTGYSSLSYLRSFPFDKIKIDQSFIRDLSTQKDSGAIVRAIAGLGATLGMRTTAEGVETADQLRRLREKGCTEVQGYLFSKPCPAADIPALITRIDAAAAADARA